MVIKVARHDFPYDDAQRRVDSLNKRVARRVDSLEQYPDSINMTLNASVTTAFTRCAIDPRAALLPTWESYVTAMQVSSALFAAATATTETVQCRIAHKVRNIQAVDPSEFYVDAGNWITAFWLAVVCRERERMTELCNVPLDLLRSSSSVYDEYVYHWVDALQTYWKQGAGLGDKLVAAMEGTDPDTLQIGDRETTLKILYPPINLFFRFILQDSDQFNTELAKALQWHKEYWSADEERTISSSGLVALGPLAVACLAYDVGIPIEVESDYLPKHLLQRTWYNEFDT